MNDQEKPPVPVLVRTEKFSPAIIKRVMSTGPDIFGCTWPGCLFSSENPGSVGAHYKVHSGKAAQRRRGERKPTNPSNKFQERLMAILDQMHDLINEVDAYEEDVAAIRKKAEAYDAIKGLLE